jgi:3-phosphoshikimate 1-carboxyvinyltransferase
MARFGVAVERDGWRTFTIPAGAGYVAPGELVVEGDASSASYFLAAGAVGAISSKPVRVTGVGRQSIQGDVKFAQALKAMGAKVQMGDDWIEASRPAGTGLKATVLKAIDADFNHIPDAAMTIAVLALFAEGTTSIRNIASWRVKETDRIAAMATELRKLGAAVVEGPDFIQVTPPPGGALRSGAEIDTYDDHRMAMCFSLVSLGGVEVVINDPSCVGKTFPGYFAALRSVVS